MNYLLPTTSNHFFKKLLLVVVILTSINTICLANIVPKNGAQLNFTQVMFEYDQVFGADEYRLQIECLTDHKKMAVNNASLAILIKTGLQFGKAYQWHYEAFNKKKLLYTSDKYAFEIAASYLVDSSLFKYKISINNKSLRQNNLIFVENLGVAINREGLPVWYLPVDENLKAEPKYRNMEMTKDGNITYLIGDDCFEKNIDGREVWKGPHDGQVSGEKSDYYHHDFAKLKDGSYIACGYMYKGIPNPLNPSIICRVRYNTLIQYNADGKAIWWWSDKDHFSNQTIFSDIAANDIETAGTHLNGFFYDEKQDAFLVSFRNISRIIKIDKKTGNILYQFGKLYENDTTVLNITNANFSKQHGPVLLADNTILFYNNNVDSKGTTAFPHVVILTQPLNNKPGKVLWDYECTSTQFAKGLRGKEGSAFQLPNKNILVGMGGENRTFEVTKDKKIVWECYFEKLDSTEKSWTSFNNYRSHFTSSLFPQYFTVSKKAESATVNPQKLFDEITINNDGTENDVYKVTISSVRGTILPQELLIDVQHEQSKNVKMKLQQKVAGAVASDKLMVTITSTTNPSDSKKFAFQISQ